MAAIDKLYVHSYYEYDELRKWAIAYYPELLFYFYDITLSWKEYEENRNYWVNASSNRAVREYDRKVGDGRTEASAINNIIKHYKTHAHYDCPIEQAKEEFETIVCNYKRTTLDWEERYTFSVMVTPLEVDRKLKWICPIPCVREYLEKNCGIKTRWYHKLFWKGKKHFN